jgi:hypothetical protein
MGNGNRPGQGAAHSEGVDDSAAEATLLNPIAQLATSARLPAAYENAKAHLAECERIDECQNWANRAEALASYARQANDDDLRRMADRIQARAIHRAGALLKQIPPDPGGRPAKTQDGAVPSLTRAQAAEAAGLSERQRKTALRVASVPFEEFERIIESVSPPTITELAERGTAKRDLSTGVGMDPYAERGLDLYETPAEAIRALLRVETFRGSIWEPACGPGAIVRELRAAGHKVFATDIEPDAYGCLDARGGVDFLMQQRAPPGVESVVTNPPYRDATAFARHALTLVPRVFLLLRLLFLESQKRVDIIDGGNLARVRLFIDRVQQMHRAGWEGPKTDSNPMALAWFCWDRNYTGPIVVERMWCREREAEIELGEAAE